MKLHEKNLKRIIRFIEEFGAIKDINIKNSSTIISPPTTTDPTRVIEIDLNRSKLYTITFEMGDIKENL